MRRKSHLNINGKYNTWNKCELLPLYPGVNENHGPRVSVDLAIRDFFLTFLLQRLLKERQWAKLSPLQKILPFHWFNFVSKQSQLWELGCENVHSQNSSHGSLPVYSVTRVWWKGMKIFFLSFCTSCLFCMFVWRNS